MLFSKPRLRAGLQFSWREVGDSFLSDDICTPFEHIATCSLETLCIRMGFSSFIDSLSGDTGV